MEVDWDKTLFSRLPAELGHLITTKYVTLCVDCGLYRPCLVMYRGGCMDCRLLKYLATDHMFDGRLALGTLLSLTWLFDTRERDDAPCVPRLSTPI